MVPACIVTYNLFMNSVDRMDQLCSTNPARQKEGRVEMSVFTYLLDISANNAFVLYKKIEAVVSKGVKFCKFKRKICSGLVSPYLNEKKKCTMETLEPTTSPHEAIPPMGCEGILHKLVANKQNKK